MNGSSLLVRRTLLLGVAGFGIAACCGTASADPGADPLDVAAAVANNVAGEVRVRARVDGWLAYQGIAVGPREPQVCILAENVEGQPRLDLIVSADIFDRLTSLGVANPCEHFVSKDIVVAGEIHHNKTPNGGTSVIMWINDLAQIESITATNDD